MKVQWNRVWPLPGFGKQRRKSNDDDSDGEQRDRRNEAGWQKDCCCSSYAMKIGLIVGLLICIAGITPAVIICLRKSGQITSTSVASIVSTTTSTSTVVTTTSSITSTSSTSTSTTTITTSTSTSTTTTAPYCITRITFDDILGQSSTSGIVPNGYNNLNWTNTYYLNSSTIPISGYQTAVYSPPFVAYNLGGSMIQIKTANGTRFAFNSIVLAAAWRDNLIWSIYGYRAGVNLVASGLALFAMNKTILTCNVCSDWDTIQMTSSGGIPRPGLSQNTTEFAFDDLCISFSY